MVKVVKPLSRSASRRTQQKTPQPENILRPTSGRRGWVFAFLCSWGGFVASIVFVSTNLSTCSLMSATPDASTTSNSAVVAGISSTTSNNNGNEGGEKQDEDKTNDDDDIGDMHEGVLSRKPAPFFWSLQQAVDEKDLKERCERFAFGMNLPTPTTEKQPLPRRIFYGALIADEPWELLDIIAKETRGVFSGMVFVESNMTQDCFHRDWVHAYSGKSTQRLAEMFATKVQIRPFLNDDRTKRDLTRENLQRQEILRGWKEMGMKPNDIGLLSDTDETFSRDFLRAMQTCPYIEQFDYNLHKCDNCIAKIIGAAKVFEASPNCITKDRRWLLPTAVMGACLEEIGDETLHPRAPRGNYLTRNPGWADKCGGVGPFNYNVPDGKFPLFNAADYRFLGGGRTIAANISHAKLKHYTQHSAFHFHNFFANFTKTRYKYYTYGHALPTAMTDRLENIQEDLRFMIRCVYNQTDGTTDPNNFRWLVYHHPEFQRFKRIKGGIKGALPPLPIYFMDEDYVRRKHRFAKKLAETDERMRQQKLNMTPDEIKLDAIKQEQREAKRVFEEKEEQAKILEAKINETKKQG